MENIKSISIVKNIFNYQILNPIIEQIEIDLKYIFKWTRYNINDFHFDCYLFDDKFNKHSYDIGYPNGCIVYNKELAETIDLSFYSYKSYNWFFSKRILRKINNSLKLTNYDFPLNNFKLIQVELNSLGKENAPCFSLIYSRTYNLPHIQLIKDEIEKYQKFKNTCRFTNDIWNNYNDKWILANDKLKKELNKLVEGVP
jgi:hypothetical protein